MRQLDFEVEEALDLVYDSLYDLLRFFYRTRQYLLYPICEPRNRIFNKTKSGREYALINPYDSLDVNFNAVKDRQDDPLYRIYSGFYCVLYPFPDSSGERFNLVPVFI